MREENVRKAAEIVQSAVKGVSVSRKSIREQGELHTVDEVATRLKVTKDTVLGWIHHGDCRGRKLGHFRQGRGFRVSDSHLEEFLVP